MVTLERVDERSALAGRGGPGPATWPAEEVAMAQRIRTVNTCEAAI